VQNDRRKTGEMKKRRTTGSSNQKARPFKATRVCPRGENARGPKKSGWDGKHEKTYPMWGKRGGKGNGGRVILMMFRGN